MSPVRVERRGIALHVLLTRPERRNALTQETMEALLAAFRQAERSDARAVVLRGEGRQFSAGGDMSMLGDIPPPADPDPLFPLYRKMGHVLEVLNALPQAVIAVVEGACTGGGLGMACCSDVVIVREDAKIGLPEARSGFIPAQVIPHIVRRMGEGWTRRLVATGAILDGRDALRDGLAHILAANPEEADAALAQVLDQVRRSEPNAVAEAKRLVLSVEDRPVNETLDDAARTIAGLLRAPAARAGIDAFNEKRPPPWAEQPSSED